MKRQQSESLINALNTGGIYTYLFNVPQKNLKLSEVSKPNLPQALGQWVLKQPLINTYLRSAVRGVYSQILQKCNLSSESLFKNQLNVDSIYYFITRQIIPSSWLRNGIIIGNNMWVMFCNF